jgi:hypothetical protein
MLFLGVAIFYAFSLSKVEELKPNYPVEPVLPNSIPASENASSVIPSCDLSSI